jgi:hypothetical protein
MSDELKAKRAQPRSKCKPGCECSRHKRVLTPQHKAKIAAANAARKGESHKCPEGCTCNRHQGYHFGGSKQGRTFSEQAKVNIANSAKQRVLDGWEPWAIKQAIYSKGDVSIPMRSGWEVDFAEALDAAGVHWTYEPKRFNLGWSSYLPDFYLPAQDLYIEVKGWLKEESGKKIAAFQDLGHKVVMVTYHPSEKGLVNSVPSGIKVVLGGDVLGFVNALALLEF